jgi:hypothetical protein
MILATAIIGGLACGYFLGFGRRGFGVLLPIWAVVLLVQTLFVVPTEDVEDVLYWPFQVAIVAVGVLMVWLGTKLRAWRARAA